jgi:hypothetical protein
MDYARQSLSGESARRPAAEPMERSAGRALTDVRRGGVMQRAVVQREGAPEEELQMKAAPGVAQRAAEDEELQMKADGSADAAQRAEAPAPANTTGLPDGLKAGVESLSGLSLDGVNVHYNSAQPAQLNALAYAQGTDIHVAPGQEAHLPHEAWHVVQQAQGRVEPTRQLKDAVSINDNAALEHEADVMGDKALAFGA